MKFPKWTLVLAMAGALPASAVFAQSRVTAQSHDQRTAFNYDSYYAQDDAVEASPSDQPVEATAEASCDSSCDTSCDSGCNGWLNCCDMGEPWSLWDDKFPCHSVRVGGWFQFGYHDEGNGLFNDHPENLNLHQGWLYVEKVADGSNCCWDYGFRFDTVYGVDAQDTQSFGNPSGEWDFENGFDHGSYGWALPQLYGEAAYGDLSIKLGHFYTIMGYEVVTAPDNFFYSHAITMYNSEPFTHTGVLGSYAVDDATTVHAGWTLGWDTGFEQFDSGNTFLGGFSVPVTDCVAMTYTASAGNFGRRGDEAYSHSLVFDWTVDDKINYVLQSDVLRVEDTGEDNFGLNQYLFYTVNDCVRLGARLEWWQGDDNTNYTYGNRIGAVDAGTHSYYEATFGVNVKPHPNFIVRPEVRQDWAPFADYDETIFGFDVIALW